MKVGGIGGYDATSGMSVKNIKAELINARTKAKGAENVKDADEAEKKKERRKAEEEINRLNRELRLEEQEEKRAKRQEKLKEITSSLVDDKDKADKVHKDDEDKSEEMSVKKEKTSDELKQKEKDTRSIFTAMNAMEQMAVRGNVNEAISNKASVLETEIAIDKGRGTDTTYKEEQLEKIRDIEINSVLDNKKDDEMDNEDVMNHFGAPVGVANKDSHYGLEQPKIVID
ncbi:MAG: hypothetical protein E7266_06135 [Lachnospiraceae bacterium]|nr:hypothetical protein [Lachnospiraceae bacterium]